MKKEEIQALFSQFEQVSCVLNDVECWSARDLCTLLGYKLAKFHKGNRQSQGSMHKCRTKCRRPFYWRQ